MDINNVLKFSLIDWVKDKAVLKYFLVVFVFYLLVNLCVGFFMYSTLMPLVDVAKPSFSQSISMIFTMVAFIAILVVVVGLVASVFNYFIISKALASKKSGAVPFSASRLIFFILVSFAESIAAVFSLYKLKLLLIPIVGVVLSIIAVALIIVSNYSNMVLSLIGILMILIALVLFLVYFVIVVYNSYRLSLSSVIFVEKERGVWDSIKLSWELTRGKVIDIFVIMLIIGIAGSVAVWIFSIPSMMYQGSFGAAMNNPSTMFKLMVDPVALALSLPSIIVQAFLVIAQLYALTAIYSQVKTSAGKVTKEPVKRSFSKPKRK